MSERNEALERLLALEQREDLWNRTVLGEQVWPMLRLRRFREELVGADAALRTTAEAAPQRTASNLGSAVVSAGNLWRRGPAAQPERDIWVLSWSTYRRGADGGGQPQCIFAEHLREQLGERLLFLEVNNAGMPDQQRDDVVFVDLPQRAALWTSRVAAEVLGRLPGLARPWGSDFPSVLLYERALYARMMRSTMRRWIARSRPRAVFVVFGYGLWQPAQQVVREAGIPLIELQHGVIYNNHTGYSVGAGGAPVPGAAPDHLVVYGRTFGEFLEQASPYWKGRWSVGGHPWLLRSLDDSEPRQQRVILFSQYEPAIQRAICEAATLLAESLDEGWEVLLKPHPGEVDSERVYERARQAGARLLGPRDDTYRLLPTAQATVCVHSTVAMESLAAGCRSAVLPWSPRPSYLAALIERGLIEPIDDPQDLAAWVCAGGERDTAAVARDLFGRGEQRLDFAALVDRLQRQ